MKPFRAAFFAWLFLLGMTTSLCAAHFRTVVIDAGHGGQDCGAVSGKVYEKHLALDTAVRLEAQLKRMGYRTVMTRRGDYFLPLAQRVQVANQYRDAIFVSVHFNHTWREGASGLETFYYSTEGKQLASYVQASMIRKIKTENRSAKFARFHVLRNSKNPAILVEGGFVSNQADREKMKGADYRESLARSVAEGIDSYRRGR